VADFELGTSVVHRQWCPPTVIIRILNCQGDPYYHTLGYTVQYPPTTEHSESIVNSSCAIVAIGPPGVAKVTIK
jgi:hypothetical protein